MKKLALVLVLVAAIAVAGFAQVTLEPTLTGSATLTFGVNLDNMATGLQNTIEADIAITLVEEATEEKGGDGTVYGWIELEDFSIVIDTSDAAGPLVATAPTISARIYMGPVYLDILGVSAEIDKAGLGAVVANDVYPATNTLATDYDSDNDGLAVVYDSDMIDFTVFVQSENDWLATTGTGANTPNGYAFGFTAGVDVSDLSVGLAFAMGFNYDDNFTMGLNPLNFGADLAYGLALGDTTLTPYVGFDGQFDVGASAFAMEIAGGVKLTWADMGTDDAEVDHFGEAALSALWEDIDTTSGIALGASFYNAGAVSDLNLKMAFYEDSGDDGLLPIIGATAVVNLSDVLTNMGLGAGLNVNADLGMISPFAGMYMLSAPGLTGIAWTELWVGVDVSVIDNTTFTLKYVSGNLIANQAGIITFATKVAF